MFKELKILGLRGFAAEQTLTLAQPTGALGSGLTVLVGANNAGKSTVVEALRAFTPHTPPSFTQGRRNAVAGDMVALTITEADGTETKLTSVTRGSSETQWTPPGRPRFSNKILVLPSRRTFSPYFGSGQYDRQSYVTSGIGFPAVRSTSIDSFGNRLFSAVKNRDAFNSVLEKVLDPVPEWTIDQLDSGQYYLKVVNQGRAHSSEGLGEGLVSLFIVVDALYDSEAGGIIVIDEPELSLHPSLQKRLAALLTEFAADRQIIISTHSPYFVNLEALQNGAVVARSFLKDGVCNIAQLSATTAGRISGMLRNYNNPHIFGLEAQEVFFLEDPVILVEGQEDVIFYEKVQEAVGERLGGVFYGWGVGGAGNMGTIALVLKDLGFERVAGFLDGNKAKEVAQLTTVFPEYRFFSIPADDVRTKEARALPAIAGLLDDTNTTVRAEHVDETRRLFQAANEYLRS